MTALIIDTETTGFKDPEAIEVAWVRLGELPQMDVVERFLKRFKPSKPIELGAMATHHILDEDLVECEPSSDFHLPEHVMFLGGMNVYLIGHNIDFDARVIGVKDNPEIKRICTCALSRHFWPDVPHALGTMLYHLFRSQARDWLRNAHSAADDVQNTLTLLRSILKEMGNPSTWEEVWQFSELARIPTRMPLGKHKGQLISELPPDYKLWCLTKMTDLDPYLEQALRNQ